MVKDVGVFIMPVGEQTPPKGYITLDEAVDRSDYTPRYLMQLAREGNIGRIEQQGIFYFSARSLQNYIQPHGYLTIGESARVTGFNPDYLEKLARKRRIKSVKKRRRVFLLARDVKKLIIPEGFVSPEEATDNAGYVAEYLIRLSRQGVIRRMVIHGQLYLSLEDIRKYNQNPQGYLSPQEATRESGYSHGGLRRLARKGRIRTTTRHEIVYFLAEDIQELKVPEGFLGLEEAAGQSRFSVGQIKYQIRTERIKNIKIGGKRYVSAEDLGIHLEKQDSNTNPEATLESRIIGLLENVRN